MKQKTQRERMTDAVAFTANPITNKLSVIRERRGVSVSALATMVGVSRQTIYAVESGSYIPNTAVALRLARALDVSVGDLFSLAEGPVEPPLQSEKVELIPPNKEFHPGQAVQLCEIDGKLVGAAPAADPCYLPVSDGVIGGRAPVRGKAKVEFHPPESALGNRLLVAGCDPAMSLLARALEPTGILLVLVHQNSVQSLELLKSGRVHVAGTHLRDEVSGEANLDAVAQMFPNSSAAVISFALWEEGLVTAYGNPRGIRVIEDLARKDITLVNREPGSGIRVLLDRRLKALGLSSNLIRGYERTAPGHLAAAREVYSGNADCCLATRAAASTFGLHFIPLDTVRYDLVLLKKHLEHPAIQTLFDVVNRFEFRVKLRSVGGYDTTVTGARLQ